MCVLISRKNLTMKKQEDKNKKHSEVMTIGEKKTENVQKKGRKQKKESKMYRVQKKVKSRK
jgi:hypothetical protein